MNKKVLSLLLALVMVIIVLPIDYVSKAEEANNNYANQVITALGVMNTDDAQNNNLQKNVTRAQFAQMLVNLSSFKDTVSKQTSVSLFPDVSKNYWAAGYIKAAIANQWMAGYINGKFRPNQAITLQEGVNAVVKMLGYSNSDFTGNKDNAKMTMYYTKKLDTNIKKTRKEKMTRLDCINLFYNTLKATTKENVVYAVSLGYKIDTKGEVIYLEILNKEMKGPVIADANWTGQIPFSTDMATVYRNGFVSDKKSIQLYDVLYYSKSLKTVWAYSEKVTGTLKAVSPDKMSPTSVTISGKTYNLDNQDIAYQFSTLGKFKFGDVITILLGKDSTVVGAINKEEYKANVNGVVLMTNEKMETDANNVSYLSTYAVVADAYGHEYNIEYNGKPQDFTQGQVVEVNYENGKATIQKDSKSYVNAINDISKDGKVLGSTIMANDVKILDTQNGRHLNIPTSRLAGVHIYPADILYYSKNSRGEVQELILNDLTGDLNSYGVITDISDADIGNGFKTTYKYIINGEENTQATEQMKDVISTGPSSFEVKDNIITEMKSLTGVMVTSIDGMDIKNYSETYTMADEVVVYYYKNSKYYPVSLSSVSDLKKFNLGAYYDKATSFGGRIRVIIAKDK